MKKILLVLMVLLLVGCEKDLNNTPTKRVEVFLGNYQSLSEEVRARIVSDVDDMPNLTEEEKESYVKLWERHYQGMTYDIKDELVDGDDATVQVEIEVSDYSKIVKDSTEYLNQNPEMFQDDLGNYSFSKFNDYKINRMSNSNEKVKYTIEFKLKKIDKKWVLQDLNDEEYLKLSGMYDY